MWRLSGVTAGCFPSLSRISHPYQGNICHWKEGNWWTTPTTLSVIKSCIELKRAQQEHFGFMHLFFSKKEIILKPSARWAVLSGSSRLVSGPTGPRELEDPDWSSGWWQWETICPETHLQPARQKETLWSKKLLSYIKTFHYLCECINLHLTHGQIQLLRKMEIQLSRFKTGRV